MATIWELDFYSRPILDEQGKKIWEVLICESPLVVDRDPQTLFRYAQFCPSSQVNSIWLQQAITSAIEQAGQSPKRIRFFRRQMNNMITRACGELGIGALPSQRTYALNRWLVERFHDVYPTMDGFQAGQADPLASAVSYQPATAKPLPDALVGQKWAFVNLEASAFADMGDWAIDFREAFPFSLMEISRDTIIPGLVIFSPRALPLAGWMAGLELAYVALEEKPLPRLILQTGAGDRWILANLSKPQLVAEAKNFEASKQAAANVHFLAVQPSPEAESFTGFWLLQEINLA